LNIGAYNNKLNKVPEMRLSGLNSFLQIIKKILLDPEIKPHLKNEEQTQKKFPIPIKIYTDFENLNFS
jgi:hypothetical protein